MTSGVPRPDSWDKESVQRWMQQIREQRNDQNHEYPKTHEEFAQIQRTRLLNSIGVTQETRGRRRIDVSLTGVVTDDHIVPASVLGSFLTSFQESVSAVAQALTGRPTTHAAIPRAIREATTLSAAATFPSSFGVALYGPPVDETDAKPKAELLGSSRTILDESVERILNIADLAEAAGQPGELLAEQLASLGQRSLTHLGTLTTVLNSAGIGMRVAWYGQTGQARRSDWSPEGVKRIRDLCEQSDFTDPETITLAGELVSASLFRSTVEIRTDTGEVIQASTGEDLTNRLDQHFNKRVEADIEVTGVKFSGGRERKIYSVLDLRNL